MKQLAADVFRLVGRPPNAINVYFVEDVLIDAGTQLAHKRILRQLSGRKVCAHALTHAHPDHHGSSHAVCEALGLPLWCGERDSHVVQGASPMPGKGPIGALLSKLPPPNPHTVERELIEGDQVGGFTVMETPGHSPGHVSFWRDSDRTLICGDVFFNLNPLTGRPGLREPPRAFTYDVELNRESARRVARLQPALVLFGHGPPLRDTERLVRFAQSLPG